MTTKLSALALGVLALVALFAVGWTVTQLREQPAGAAAHTPASAVARTSLPGLTAAAATAEATLPSLRTLAPGRGKVVHAQGPFDDRFTMRDLTFDGSLVTGSAAITSDVSDILEFQALAGFYDAGGRLLGTAAFTYHHDESTGHQDASEAGPPNELQKFSITVPANLRGTAVSAAVGVAVLVNE